MAKRKKTNPNQIDFFNQLTSSDEIEIPNEPTGTMNSNLIKIALSEAIKKSCFERFEICERISELAGRKITVAMMNAYTSQSRTTHNIPCDLLIPITFVLGASVLSIIADNAGCTLATRPQMQMAHIGQLFTVKTQIQEKLDKEIQNVTILKRVAS